MKKITITLPPAEQREYPIYIGTDLIAKIATLINVEKYSKLFIITDQIIEGLFLEKLQKNLPEKAPFISLPPGEQAKDIKYLTKIWKAMIDAHMDRNSLIINFGGGVIGDIGGFAASTYMRGIEFINIPTTLLAQVDESVGGKTMIDFHGIKNIVGTFYQPSTIIIDIDTLRTLPKREFISSFAEIIKHGLIKDRTYLEFVTSKKPQDFTESELIDIIKGSCEIKAEIVQNDETESGLRKLINFGHTIGHAVEALSLETENPLLHGEAVSIGMVEEAILAEKIGLLPSADVKRVKELLEAAGLPTAIPEYQSEDILKKMKSDKKNVGGKINFTLLREIGKGVINQTVADDIIIESLKQP
ncbi:MAG TPA: 3-dehydroquinate synthase [Candidatus Acidoferrales bacterium]|nr:3-dehydroquinate synthase [Candidatus Acidoferrales bacterium]